MLHLTTLLLHYGYGILFTALLLEMLALPLPGEMMMSYAGLFVYEGKLNMGMSIAAAWLGVSVGISLSYWIGYRLGKPFVLKHGHKVHLGEPQMDAMTRWFARYGNKLLFIAFFIPGVRHITGYFCGITQMPFRRFAGYAFSGALFWTGVFITLGKVLGPKWEVYHSTVNRYMLIFGIGSALLAAAVYAFRRYKKRILEGAMSLLRTALLHFSSLGKVRFLVLVSFLAFVGFVSLMLGLIQDFLARDFDTFDDLASYLILTGFGPGWKDAMNLFSQLGTVIFYGPVILLAALRILLHNKDRLLELGFLVWVMLGGELLDTGLRELFHRPGPVLAGYRLFNTFPSTETLTTFIVCGFSAYLLVRHSGSHAQRLLAFAAVLLICLLVGLSRIYFHVQYPSDVAAGYVFGGVWVSLNITLLEVTRRLQTVEQIP
ncbi:bifunctional DedA family/phosphatase PAP2 family protein [Paenibacillus sp. HN-1]|uniref:bifunctional DedA family/phosphatase PAP2 family protein n=1 Tax=Paenibacillus TaxID=44249 RepID=UPI001CA9F2BB|nr:MULTISPECIES: bifunctional DedA family/phosphatase PAP2 family protein [Paenibacillus]MBY9079306.1 bifunctional DedA family/phosphatase PAP2 family protein [Paenibacillus sp. CGMCC 1.18879]MBY9087029.1 bifunctional DedA family/phosphatase PAP2 family protein [Paenibacillus sinensis]